MWGFPCYRSLFNPLCDQRPRYGYQYDGSANRDCDYEELSVYARLDSTTDDWNDGVAGDGIRDDEVNCCCG